MIRNYFKTAWRSIIKNKTTSIINVIGLSVGMTAAVLILLWVQNETSFDNYHKEKDNIFRLTTSLPEQGWIWESTPLLLADAIQQEIPEIEKTTRLNTSNWPVFNVNGTLFYEKECAYVDSNWFNIFRYSFIEGDANHFDEHPFNIILTASAAKKYFGEQQASGQTILIDSTIYQVVAVVADAPVNSSFQYSSFMPIAALLTNPQIRENDEQWSNANYITFIKTKTGANTETVIKKVNEALKKKAKDQSAAPVSMISLSDMHFESEIQQSIFAHGNRTTVFIFTILGFLLLLIACINYVNLTTAKASLRAKEVSIRKIAGAGRSDLFFQFTAESVIISIISLLATIILLQFCLPIFNQLTGRNFALSFSSSGLWKVILITLFSALILNSIYPSLLLSSFKPLNVFRGSTLLKIKDSTFRKGLVVFQFAVSVVLIAGTIVIYTQMEFIQKRDPGYNRSQVVSFVLPASDKMAERVQILNTLKLELLGHSSIESVSTSNQPLVNIGSMCSECADWPGREISYNPKIVQLSADADFLKTMQLKMKEGLWFESTNTSGNHGFILNETAVKEFKLATPVTGQQFIFRGDTGRVSGVVKDFTYKSMHEKTGPLVVFDNPAWRNHFVVRTAAKNSLPAMDHIQNVWKKHIPGSPLEFTFLDESFDNLYKEDRKSSFIIMVFAGIAVMISALGLFSLAAFQAEQRTKEIGVRKVLGATVSGIIALLSKEFIKLVAIAILIATPISWWVMSKWIQNFAYRIDLSWWIFFVTGIMVIVVALTTVIFQAIKAALANPVKSLRTE